MTTKEQTLQRFLSGRRVLVSGARGFIGSHLCRRLIELGAEVYGVSRRAWHPPMNPDVRWVRADLSILKNAEMAVEASRPKYVFHLCSHAEGGQSADLVVPTLCSELVPTINMLAATQAGACRRFVMAGSLEEPLPGHTATSPYAAAKAASVSYGRLFHKLFDSPVVILRIFMVYGPGQRPHKLVPYTVRCLLNQEAPMLGGGRRRIDWIYVTDVVESLVAAAVAPGVEGCTFEIGSGTLHSIAGLVKRIRRIIGAEIRPEFDPGRDRLFETVRKAAIGPARKYLNWRPSVSLDEGLRATVDWYRNTRLPGTTGSPDARTEQAFVSRIASESRAQP